MVAGAGAAALVDGAALVGVGDCSLCGAGDVVEAAPAEVDAALDDEALGDSDVAVVEAAVAEVDVVADAGVSEVAGVDGVVDVVSDGALGVLVGSTAGTSAAAEGGTV